MINLKYILAISVLLIFVSACDEDDNQSICEDISCGNLTAIPFDPEPYDYDIPIGLPLPNSSVTSNTTIEGVALGRRLFYDPILSADSSMSCSSCHMPNGSFTDNLAVSTGVDNIAGKRSSMSLLNVAYYDTGLFWDGRVQTLEEQALLPIEDPIEFHTTWPEVIEKLKRHEEYPTFFRKAFGIDYSDEITNILTASALAQFQSTFISSGNSKFDRWQRLEYFFTDDELAGYELFFDLNSDLPDAECGHCHNAPIFTTNEFFNNGIDAADDISDFVDPGFGMVTNDPTDYGKFRAPTLRNVTASAPYMHDGRFETLEEVLEHYNSGGKSSVNKDPLVEPLNLTEEHIMQLIAFIKTLDDPDFMNNENFQSPF